MSLLSNVQTLHQMILSGKMLDAFEQFYADDVVMQEPGEAPRVGKDTNRIYEQNFVASLKAVHAGSVKSMAINEETGTVFAERSMDVEFATGMRVVMEQVSVQTRVGDKVVHERFYYNKG